MITIYISIGSNTFTLKDAASSLGTQVDIVNESGTVSSYKYYNSGAIKDGGNVSLTAGAKNYSVTAGDKVIDAKGAQFAIVDLTSADDKVKFTNITANKTQFSISGGLLSFAAMTLLKRTNKFSVVGVSAAGGFFHNVGQILAAIFFMDSKKIFLYLPILGICGIFIGALIGLLCAIIMRGLKN